MKCRPTRANLARVQDGLSLSADADADDLGVRKHQRIVPWVVATRCPRVPALRRLRLVSHANFYAKSAAQTS